MNSLPFKDDDDDDDLADALAPKVAAFQNAGDPDGPPTCKCSSPPQAEELIIKAMKKGAKMADVRLDLTYQNLTVVPADVLRLGESLVQLSVVGNGLVEMPADLDLCRRLRVLNLSCNELSGLPKLSGLRELVHVGLGYNRITDRDLTPLKRNLPGTLQSLDLTANDLVNLEGLLELFEEGFTLKHFALKHNPLAINPGYRNTVVKSAFGALLTMLDGVEVVAADPAAEAAAKAAAEAEAAAKAEAGEDEDEGEEEEDDEDDSGPPKAHLKLTIMQLSGIPEEPAAAPAADGDDAPAEGGEGGGGGDQMLEVEFTLHGFNGGEPFCTKPLPRAPTVDFESTTVDLGKHLLTAELRDQLVVHGIPFDVYTTAPAPPAEEGDEGGGEEGAEPERVRTLLGRVTTHWGSLAAGEAELTQVSSALVQPAAPEKKKKKGKKQPPAKRPPPFQLSITASLLIVEKKSSD